MPLLGGKLVSALTGVIFVAFGLLRPAFAATPELGDGLGAHRTRSWYGWQVLIADGVATGLIVTAAATESRPVFTVGIVSYALAAPAVHVLHDRPLPGVGSLALRVALPGLFGLIGYGSVSCRSDYADEAEGAACTDQRRTRGTIGLIAGAAIATGLDVGVIAFDRRRPSRRAGRFTPRALMLMPMLSPGMLGMGTRMTF